MTSERVIRGYLVIAGIYTVSASLIWGVNTLFLLDAGLDIFEVFVANAAFTAGMVVFEIPTGVLADTAGRRASFLWSVAVLAAGTMAYVGLAQIGAGLIPFIAASVVLGLGFTFYSGAVEAWLVDALTATGYQGNLETVFARGGYVTGAAMLFGTTTGGVLGGIDLAIPFVARTALLILALGVAWVTMHDLGFQPRAVKMGQIPTEMRMVARASLDHGWRNRPVRLFMYASMVQGAFMAWGWYAWQPYLLELLERDAVWVAGVVAALLSVSIIVGNGLVEFFTRFCGKRTTMLLWSAGIQTAAVALVGLSGNFYAAVAGLMLWAGGMGVYGPVKQAFIHQVIPSEQRATVISFDAMLGSVGGVGGQMGLGYLARARSIETGYVTGAVAMGIVVPIMGALRKAEEPADVFAGTRAGQDAPCAAQGIPDIATVDAVPRQAVEV